MSNEETSPRVEAGLRRRVLRAIAKLGYNVASIVETSPVHRSHTLNQSLLTDARVMMRPSIAPALTPATRYMQQTQLPPLLASRTPTTTARTLLKIVRGAQPISRADLARRLGVNRSTVTEIVRPLLDADILREKPTFSPSRTTQVGRPPIALTLNADERFFIGVNIGVRQSQVGALTLNDETLAHEVFDTPKDPAATLARVADCIKGIRAQVAERKLSLIGVSVPGPVDEARGKLLYAPHLAWNDVEIATMLQQSSGITSNPRGASDTISNDGLDTTLDTTLEATPVILENDATAAAVYEARRRLARIETGAGDDFILLRVGTGIGVGLVLGGEVYRGGAGVGAGMTGEFGHMTIVAGGKQCVCGNRGCWERYASASSAATLYNGERTNTSGTGALRFLDVVARAEAGERRARATLEQVGDYLGIGIANVISGLGVTNVIVSGRIVHGWTFIRDSLHEALTRSMVGRLTRWSVEAGEPTGAGLGGALEVAIDEHIARLAP
ncbi:MAG: ROK family transcriptional regulator [Pyrinomonadaceae bacterium MAG19_C2-C3]|nr:ROK family transcriptional regulator [Pyrinomonadaceae bacterium MAG19_C2-C3]